MSSANPEHRHGTPASTERSSPPSTPFRNDSRESDTTKSSTSRSWSKNWATQATGAHEQTTGGGDGPLPISSAATEEAGGQDTSRGVAKHRTGHSGGFLLDSALHASRLPKAILSRTHKIPKDLKGKRKSEEGDLVVAKRRLAGRRDQQRSSIGGSPLASEVKQDGALDDTSYNGRGQPSAHSQQSTRLLSEHTGGREAESTKSSVRRPIPSGVGFDTDPAQIVNMALSLSEGRRRQVSGLRMVSGDTPTPERRRISAGKPSHLRSVGYGTGLGQPFHDQRRVSQNIATRPLNASSTEQQPLSSVDHIDFGDSSAHGSHHSEDEQNLADYYISPATLGRVEKAKAHFELLYNYRRLLSHLPPLRPPTGSADSAFRDFEGRFYNPLQYVRNRKLRFHERKPLESEDEGWHDITQVRPWVDAVIASNTDKCIDVDECIRLPEFSQHKLPDVDEEDDPLTAESPTSSVRRNSAAPAIKPRRPRLDWVTYPGDLLADAFWLEQGLNKTKIEDKEGQKIYRPDTQFKFSGWRNRTPVHIPDWQESTPPPEDDFDVVDDPPPSAVPELPTFTSAAEGRKRSSRGKIRNSIISMPKTGSGSRDRRRRLQQELENTSSSESSEDERSQRGRKRKTTRRRPRESETRDGEDEDGHVQKLADVGERNHSSPNGASSGTNSGRHSIVDGSRLSKLISKTSSKPSSLQHESHRRSDSIRRSFEHNRRPRSSFEDTPVRTSAEYDTTAPSSPTAIGFPSIAINLSPPASRSPSPSKKPFQARLNPFRDRSNSKKRNRIETNDFAEPSTGKSSRNASIDVDKIEVISEPNSRGTSPMTRGTSPMTKRDSIVSNDSQTQHDPRQPSSISRISTKSSGSHPEHASKIRGIFKGGRIAEIVGNEVTRVGDFIWKRDVPGHHFHRKSASTASLESIRSSDSEDRTPDANGHAYRTPLKLTTSALTQSADSSPEDGRTSPSQSHSSPNSNEKPQYHNTNLPSFTSPFQHDREQQEKRDNPLLTPTSSPPQQEGTDHISRLAANHRSASRSPRMDRLAPPKLVTTGHATSGLDRQESYGFGRALDLTRSTNASQVFNDAIKGLPKDVPVTGLANEKISASGLNLVKDWNLSDRNLARPEGDDNIVTRQDISRTRALLLSSGVKAREINRRANAISDPPRQFLLDTIEHSNSTPHKLAPLRVPRREEHVVAARNVISSLTSQYTSFKEVLGNFSTKTMPALHTDLQALDDLVDNQLTPRVRVAADQAGELSMKFSTTSTLAVKGLNDIIDSALRRRRRGPVRYLRRAGYTLIEWTVVGLLWAIWLVVTIFRVGVGTLRGVFSVVRWLLFL